MDQDDELAELVQSYLKTLPQKLEQIKLFFQTKNLKDLKEQIHKLTGSSGLYGLEELSCVSENLENILVSSGLNEKFEHEFIKLEEEINQLLGKP